MLNRGGKSGRPTIQYQSSDPSLSPLLKHIILDSKKYPHLALLTLQAEETFLWNHTTCTISYNPDDPDAAPHLLHEYGHALLRHTGYSRDVELIAMERAAWDQALGLGQRWDVPISASLIESALDTYRDWLHARSLCPRCGATGIQRVNGIYNCLACYTQWRTNAATTCRLRRRVIAS